MLVHGETQPVSARTPGALPDMIRIPGGTFRIGSDKH
jgi:formylglycine-generating enzyme required for sulfatase activity